ncbi:MAG: arylamine N-acetyltransferase, partial [Spongiibacteraceae bacterium]|nr:arylamine N-acetyltransferase [Spongiibacteraceae bacterium]
DLIQTTSHESFRVRQLNECDYLLEALVGGEWQSLYEFDTRPQLPVDYELSNWYISTHPESRFVNHLIAALPAPDGRHTLLDNRYSRHYLEAPSEHRLITDSDELHHLLRETFAINVPADSALWNRVAQLALRPADPAGETAETTPVRATET